MKKIFKISDYPHISSASLSDRKEIRRKSKEKRVRMEHNKRVLQKVKNGDIPKPA